MRETRVWALGWEDSLEKEMATYSSTIAWKIPWTEEPGKLQSTGLQKVWHNWVSLRAWSQGLIGYLKEFRFGPMAMESHPKVYSEGWKNWINVLGDHSKLQLFSCSVVSNSLAPLDCSMPGYLVFLSLLEFAQTPVHWVDDAIHPSHLLSPPSPYALDLSQHQGLFQWVGSKLQYDKLKKR